MKLKTRDLAVALVLMVGLLGAVMATNSASSLAVATCGISGCVSTPPLSSSTTYDYTGTSVFTLTSTSTTESTSFSSSTTSTTVTSTTTSWSYTSTISTTITTTSFSTTYTGTQSSLNTAVYTVPTTTTTYSTWTALQTVSGVGASNCPIATVTNGNRLQPYAQFLRNFRDNQIENTTAGRVFLTAFNSWYYSWAPAVAYSAATSPVVYRVVQAGVVPLLGILYASYYSYTLVAPLSPEAAAIMAGVVAASLIGLAYVAPVAYLTSRLLRRHMRFNLSTRTLTPTAVWLTASVITLVAAYATASGTVLAIGVVNLVLSALSAGTLAGARLFTQIGLPTINPATIPLLLRRYKTTLLG